MAYLGSATLMGPGHKSSGLPNQDYADYAEIGDGFALVLADGAGSKKLSDRGAWMAASTVLRSLQSSVRRANETGDAVTATEALELAVKAAVEFVNADEEAEELGSTLLCAFAYGEELTIGSIGDSLVLVKLASGELELVLNERVSEFANETDLVTSRHAKLLTRSYRLEEVEAVALVSDGFEDFAFSQGLIFEPFWDRVFDWASREELELQAMLDHVEKSGKLSDDTTIVLYARGENWTP